MNTAHFPNINFNIFLPSAPSSSNWYILFRLSKQFVLMSCLPRMLYALPISSSFHLFVVINSGDEYKLRRSTVQFFPAFCPFTPLRYKYYYHYRLFWSLQSMFLPYCERPVFRPIQRTTTIIILNVQIGTFLDGGREIKSNEFVIFWTNIRIILFIKFPTYRPHIIVPFRVKFYKAQLKLRVIQLMLQICVIKSYFQTYEGRRTTFSTWL